MENMVEHYQNELLPVAAELTARLVSSGSIHPYLITETELLLQCETYTRLARESLPGNDDQQEVDVDHYMDERGEDKTFAAMGVAKTIGTVRIILEHIVMTHDTDVLRQVINAVDSSPELLAQVQEIIIPVVLFTLENKLLGTSLSIKKLCAKRVLTSFILRSLRQHV